MIFIFPVAIFNCNSSSSNELIKFVLASCFQRVFGVIEYVEFTFQHIYGGTVCNLRFSFSVAGALARAFGSKSRKFDNGFGGGQRRVPRYTIFCVPHCVGVVAHGWFTETSFGISSKFSKDLENDLLDGNTS